MKIKILLLSFMVLIANTAFAENWICYDSEGVVNYMNQGDCLSIGLCSDFNNQGLRANCFEATNEEFEKAKQSYVKVDMNVVVGSKVIDLSAEEKSLKIQDEANKAKDESDKREALISSIKQKTGLTDEEISFLLNN